MYRNKSHIKCYNFCQQCEGYFATIRTKGANQTFFAISFFWDWINFCWQLYKQKQDKNGFLLITWDEFKAFFCRNLGNSWAFVNNYWRKIKRDFQYQLEKIFDLAVHLE